MATRKVLYVITKSNWGGAQRYVYDLATSLDRDQFEPVVALGGTGQAGAKPGRLMQDLAARGVRTRVIEHFMRDMSLAADLAAFLELFRVVLNERPEVLHVTSSKAGGLGVLVGRLARVPRVIFTSHGLAYDESWRPSWQRILIKLATYLTVLLSTNTILITRDTHARLSSLPFLARKVALVHNGIPAPTYLDRTAARTTLLPKVSAEGTYWIGTIAEYHPNKNLDALIEAFAPLAERYPQLVLVLIGEGEERPALEKRARQLNIEDRVHLVGSVPDAARYLLALDLFCLPSRKEGLPYVLLEAGYARLPVIASALPGLRDVIMNDVTGYLVGRDVTELTRALERAIGDPEAATRVGNALYEHVSSNFSLEQMCDLTTRLYSPTKPSNS